MTISFAVNSKTLKEFLVELCLLPATKHVIRRLHASYKSIDISVQAEVKHMQHFCISYIANLSNKI